MAEIRDLEEVAEALHRGLGRDLLLAVELRADEEDVEDGTGHPARSCNTVQSAPQPIVMASAPQVGRELRWKRQPDEGRQADDN